MKKIIYLLMLLSITAVACIEETIETPTVETKQQVAKKGRPRATSASFSVYYSPDASTPYSCYTPCLTVPTPTGLEPVSNSGTVIQIILQGLGYSSGFNPNYADSIQYIVGNGTNGVCWTEKWCNTNGAFMPISQLQGLLNQAGVTNTNNLTATVIPFGAGGQAGTTFTTPPFSL